MRRPSEGDVAIADDDAVAFGLFPSRSADQQEDIVAHAGGRLPDGVRPADRDALLDALRDVHDPEIPVNIVDLGLIYRIDIDASGDVSVDMTLTAPACPVAGEMPRAVANALSGVEGTGRVEVRLVWEPAWSQDRMSDDAKLALGLF